MQKSECSSICILFLHSEFFLRSPPEHGLLVDPRGIVGSSLFVFAFTRADSVLVPHRLEHGEDVLSIRGWRILARVELAIAVDQLRECIRQPAQEVVAR